MITGGKTQARDDVFTLLKTTLDTTGTDVIWQEELEEKDVDRPLLLVHMQHLLGQQAAITQGLGCTKWQQQGFVTIEIRHPVKQGGLTARDETSTIIENALRGKSTPNGVWFRDVVGREVPPKDGNARAEVKAEFIYQEMT